YRSSTESCLSWSRSGCSRSWADAGKSAPRRSGPSRSPPVHRDSALMCGRYTLATPDPADIRARFPVGEQIEIRRRYNVAPGDDVLAVTTDREGAPRGELLRWGLVPSWAKGPDTGLKMINARVERAAESPAFGRPFERYRCL